MCLKQRLWIPRPQLSEHCVRYRSIYWRHEGEGRELAFSGAAGVRKTEKVEDACG